MLEEFVYQDMLEKAIEQNISGSEFFFDLANEVTIGYRCATKSHPIIRIHQDQNIKDCTGGIIWETAFLLASYLEPILLGNSGIPGRSAEWKNVLEVGAGTGLLGLVLAHHGCNVILTEAPEALHNLETNVSAATGDSCAWEGRDMPRAAQLRWERAEDRAQAVVAKNAPFDLIVGTDVIFAAALVEPLLQTLHGLSNEDTVVYLCFQERCADAHKALLELAPRYFEVFDDSPLLAKDCCFAQELECWLIRLSGSKSQPKKRKKPTSSPVNQSAEPRASECKVPRQKESDQELRVGRSKRPKKLSKGASR